MKNSIDKKRVSSIKKTFKRLGKVLSEATLYNSDNGLGSVQAYEKINEVVRKLMEDVKADLSDSQNLNWETLTVSFFGETGAGKSTIMEALTGGNGGAIGKGQKDCTEKNKSHKYKNFEILDMPGIEGNNPDVLEEIKKAVIKSHIIFYVLPTGKSPEEKILELMKSYLKDQARVYLVRNIKGFPSDYEGEQGIEDRDTAEVMRLAERHFKKHLGNNFVSSIYLNAHLAFLALGKNIIPRFHSDRSEAFRIWKDEKEIIAFSQFNKLHDMIGAFRKEGLVRATHSNCMKLRSSLLKSFEVIASDSIAIRSSIVAVSKIVAEFSKDFGELIKDSQGELERKILSLMEEFELEAKEHIHESIRESFSEKKANKYLKDLQSRYTDEANELINLELKSMTKSINKKLLEFSKRIEVYNETHVITSSVNVKAITQALEKTFMDHAGVVLDVILKAVGTILAFAFNPILGIFSALISIWDFFSGEGDRKRQKAIKEANKLIEDASSSCHKEIMDEVRKRYGTVGKKLAKVNKDIIDELKLMMTVLDAADDILIKIKNADVQISTLCISLITSKKIKLVHQSTGSLLVLGDFPASQKVKLKKYFPDEEVFNFHDPELFISQIGKVSGGRLVTENEDHYYLGKVLLLNLKNLEFDQVERKAG